MRIEAGALQNGLEPEERQNARPLMPGDGISVSFLPAGTLSESSNNPSIKSSEEDHQLLASERDQLLMEGGAQRKVKLIQKEDGRVRLEIDPAPISDLVFSGGGAKGVAYPGALQVLEDRGILGGVQTVSGSSVGAITAALVSSGVSADAFTELSNNLDLIGLLDDPNEKISFIQHLFTVVGDALQKIWSTLALLLNILPRIQSSAVPLETLLVNKCRASTLAVLEKHPEVLADPTVAAIKSKLEGGGEVTFGDVALLNRHVPEIKKLNITGTAMFEGRAQLVVFSDRLTPDMSIARAAHISASFPVVFSQVDEQGHPFQENGEHTYFQDGGVMLNTPAPEIFDPANTPAGLHDSDKLIFKFESNKTAPQDSRPGKLQALADWFLGAPRTAQGMAQARGLEPLKDQIVTVPLNTDFGDFRGMLTGTVNFFMSDKEKLGLQALLASAVEKHLASRGTTCHDFSSAEEAFLAIGEEVFDGVMEQGMTAAQGAVQFRLACRTELQALVGAIAVAETPAGDLQRTPELMAALGRLDGLASTPVRQTWLATQLLQKDNPDLQRLLAFAGDQPIDCSVLNTAIELVKQGDARVIAENIVREIIDPALCRYGQTDSNIELLSNAKADLTDCNSRAQIDRVLDSIIEHYQSRHSILFAAQTPHTVEMAKAWRTAAKNA
ncbi:patatin-like phospholipase family protein [Pseudomonas plecoglossicida]|uniref:patatin-like phospholipase family protein n=1 Tax=Pseudomonas plecoglossicida TaxID=70775 RepID=UPI00048EB9D3|nr:patatin-like phospholipase family protein [Pseudomonas plecoglossicida]GLR37909.1 hypothetical protein GCM10011247_33070 [Pseudomonas plecoglossicida]